MDAVNCDAHGPPSAAAHPAWIGEELIQATLRVWQPYYDVPLTRQDAIEIILAAGSLFTVLMRGAR
jgi:hypothetical protein